MLVCFLVCVFFFKQKTAYEMRISDWSSGVCSSDLHLARPMVADGVAVLLKDVEDRLVPILALGHAALGALRCGQLRSVAIIVGRIAALDVGDRKSVV